jgi:hypothetical protein
VVDMTRVRNRLHALLLVCDSEYQHRLPSLTDAGGGGCLPTVHSTRPQHSGARARTSGSAARHPTRALS